MAESDDRALAARARGGDREAFSELVRAHQRRVWGLAAHLLGSPAEADDAVQEAFVRAYRAMDRFDGRSEFATWLHRIVVNVCLNALRSRKRTSVVAPDDPRLGGPAEGADPAATADQRRRTERLAAAVDGLSLTLRTTLILVAIQGMSHKEAALVLGCPEGTVAWRVHEARRRLREALGEQAPMAEAAKVETAAQVEPERKSQPSEIDPKAKDETDEGWD